MKKNAILITFLSISSLADIMPETPIPDLYGRADTVFVGRVTDVRGSTASPAASATEWSVDFVPLRIYKGSASPAKTSVVFRYNPA
jgi:hypothetical protein